MSWKKTVYYSGKGSGSLTMVGKYQLLGRKSASTTNELNLMRLPFLYKHIQPRARIETHSNSDDKDFLKNCFFNQCFDKGRLKNFVLWFLKNYGQNKTVKLVEQLKNIGFEYASKAGISLGIDDLKIPYTKYDLIFDAEKTTTNTIHQYVRGEITGVERFQRLIDTWHRTSESLKQEVIDYFEATDILNPVYMMAFSGARGNISQVRQLVGMRGLMADPQGQIIDFPIRSNFREGLTLTEYLISSYGARKGIVDTALRTANAGYLTRRLVDVAQHVIISHFDCGTHRGIFLKDMKEGNKTIHSLIQRVVGRILARDLIDTSLISKDNLDSPTTNTQNKSFNNLPLGQNNSLFSTQGQSMDVSGENLRKYPVLAKRNDEITMDLALSIVKKFDKIFVRSPLTCETNQLICQLCYGWSLAQGSTLVSIGEAVGVVAAQSIGEPGTQLTMRTFHTGGVFSGDISDQIRAPFYALVEYPTAIPGTLIRTPEGKIAFLTKGEGSFSVEKIEESPGSDMSNENINSSTTRKFKIPSYTLLYIRNKQSVNEKEVIAQISTISRKSNATDAAQLTIQSEYEGQFFSKSLSFREKFVGDAKLIESSLAQIRSQKNQSSDILNGDNLTAVPNIGKPGTLEGVSNPIFPSFRTSNKNPTLTSGIAGLDRWNRQPSETRKTEGISYLNDRLNTHHIDKLYEAWNWGYAWVLSGKIYELNLRGETCFPKLGDLVNSRSSMNQTQWNFHFNNGPAKLYYPSQKPEFGGSAKSYLPLGQDVKDWTEGEGQIPLNSSSKLSKLFNSTSFANISTRDASVRRGGQINIINAQNEHSASVSAQQFIYQQPLVSPTSNVTIAQPFFFLNIFKIRFKKYGYILTSRNKNSSFENNFFGEDFLRNDLLFRMYDINPRISNTLVKKKNLRTPQKNSIGKGNRTLLHWFPNQSQTSTGGFIIFEKVFHNKSYSSINITPPINIGSRTSPNGTVSKLGGKNVFDISNPWLNNKETAISSYKKRSSKSKNLEFFGTTLKNNNTEGDASNNDSRFIKKDSSLPQLRSGCIQSPLQKPIKFEYFPSIAGYMQLNFTNPKFSPVSFIKGRGFETAGFRSFIHQRGHTATLSLKNLSQSTQNSNIQYAKDAASTANVFTSQAHGIESNGVLSTLKDRHRKKSYFSPFRFQTSAQITQSGTTRQLGAGQNISNQHTSIKKQYVSASFKADFIKQLNTELNSEKTQLILINESLKDKETFCKGDPLKGLKREQNRLKSLSAELYKSRPFGMRWKNSYQIGLRSRLDNLYSPNHNKEKTTSVDSSIMNPYLNVSSMYHDKSQNNAFESLVNKRLLWIPNQFFKVINTTKLFHPVVGPIETYDQVPFSNKKDVLRFWDKNRSSTDYLNTLDIKKQAREEQKSRKSLPVYNTVNIRPKEAQLFFSKSPLFLQTNRQGHLKPFTSFIHFPSLLKTFNFYRGNSPDLEFDSNKINSTNKTLSNTLFTQYKESSSNESFALNEKWSYCGKKSNLSIYQKQVGSSSSYHQKEIFHQKNLVTDSSFLQSNHLSPITTKKKAIRSSPNFAMGKKWSSLFYYNNNYSLGQLVSHFITFCTLTTFNEKKLKETWLSRLKKEFAFFSPGPAEHSIYQVAQTADSHKYDFQRSNSGNERKLNSEKLTSKENDFSRTNGFDLLSKQVELALTQGKAVDKNKVPTSKVNLSKNYKHIPIVSNSIKRQLKRLNRFSHIEQLSLYLLSLDFQASFISSSSYARVDQSPTDDSQDSINLFSAGIRTFNELGHSSTNRTVLNTPASTKEKASITRKSCIRNLNLKKGWIFLANNPLKMLAHHKTILYPGQINDFQLNSSRPLYLECHSITDVFDFQKHCFSAEFNSSDLFHNSHVYRNHVVNNDVSYTELEDSGLPIQSPSETSYVNFQNKECIKNFNSRFCLPPDLLNIQPNHQKKAGSLPSTHFGLNLEDFKSSSNELVLSSNNNISPAPVKQEAIFNKESSSELANKNEYPLLNSFPIINSSSVAHSSSKNSNLALMQQKRKILLSFLSQLQLFNTKSKTNDNHIINNNIVLLIQPIEEYMPMNSKELKTYVSESTLKEDPVYTNQEVLSFRNRTLREKRNKSILVNPYLSSLLKKRRFQIHQFNKQKLGSQSLSKFPTTDINIHPMSIDNNFAIETSLGNEKIQTPYYRGLNIQKRPINLSPFFLSYSRPMGFDSIFKDQDVSLSYQAFSHFDFVVFPQISSSVSSVLNLYLTTKMNQRLKYFHSTSSPNKLGSSFFNSHLETSSFHFKNGITNNMEGITKNLNTDFLSRLVQSPCFCFQNIFQFKNPILTFENLQKDFFGASQFYSNPLKPKRKNKPFSKPNGLRKRNSSTLNVSNSNMSSTLFSYSQRNEMFVGVRQLAKTNVFSPFNGEVVLLNVTKGCMVLTTSNLTSYYLAPKSSNYNKSKNKNLVFSTSKTDYQNKESDIVNTPFRKNRLLHQDKLITSYPINNILVRFLNMTDIKLDFDLACKIHGGSIPELNKNESQLDNSSIASQQESDNSKMDYQNHGVISNIKSKLLRVSNLVGGKPNDLNIKVRLGDFCVYGDPITNTTAIQTSGQLVHFNNQKITLRRSQPIFISPKGILHKFDNDFIDPKTPVITLSYQKLKTGDIIQGIPKVEQFFEARTTKRGRFFRDSLPYLLKSLFKRYSSKLPLDLAVRQSFYKIQQILVDGVHRVYKAQGVTISDKHLEVIVKQMTSKVRIIDGAQTGFFQGEVIDLFFVEKINSFLMKKMTYEPLVLGITKASLEVDSFLSAASFQQTTRVLSKAALFRKKDFLKGLKENVILGNLIPAGTGFLVYIDL